MNEVKIKKVINLTNFFGNDIIFYVNGKENWSGNNPGRKIQTILSIAI